MLHILWILIKFILILLGILLGLLLLAVLLILFCPVRYRAFAVKDTDSFRKISAGGRVSWLFGAVSFQLQYKNGEADSDFRLFGIPVMKLIQKFRNRRSSSGNQIPDRPTNTENNSTVKIREDSAIKETTMIPINSDQKSEKVSSVSETEASNEFNENGTEDAEREADLEYARTKLGNFFYKLGSLLRSLWNRLNRLWQKICRIPSSVENFTLTIQNVCAKIESYQKFLEHPRTKAAFTLVKSKIIRLLHHVFPTRIQGKLTFGSTDPSVTGAVLAILGMTIPLHKNCIAITPLFEDRNVIRGNVQLKGRIYGVVLVKTALELYFNKNIKYIIRRWKHK